MKLPNAVHAYVPLNKLADYLLSATHPVGKAKAVVLRRYGFHSGNIAELEMGLLTIARTGNVSSSVTSTFGTKYVIDGVLPTPDKRALSIRTVWIVEHEQDRPRFVTAYPRLSDIGDSS